MSFNVNALCAGCKVKFAIDDSVAKDNINVNIDDDDDDNNDNNNNNNNAFEANHAFTSASAKSSVLSIVRENAYFMVFCSFVYVLFATKQRCCRHCRRSNRCWMNRGIIGELIESETERDGEMEREMERERQSSMERIIRISLLKFVFL